MIIRRIWRKIIGELNYAKKRGLNCGKNVSVMGNVNFGSEPYLIDIGDAVRISFDVAFITHDGGTFAFRHLDKYKNTTAFGKIVIGNHTFIGARSIIMPGVRIGNNCVIGAGSIVFTNVAPNVTVMGNPATILMRHKDH